MTINPPFFVFGQAAPAKIPILKWVHDTVGLIPILGLIISLIVILVIVYYAIASKHHSR